MKRKIVGILVVTLLIAAATLPVVGINDVENEKKNYSNSVVYENNNFGSPDDFNLDAFCGGFTFWTEIYRVKIDNQGNGIYSICYPKDRGTSKFTEIIQFNLDQSQMNQLWDEIVNNDFFNLEGYTESDVFPDTDIIISGGTFANIIIIANGEKHAVETRHFTVTEFDNIMMKINSVTPLENDLFYNGILNTPPLTPSIPSGPESGNFKEEHTYTTSGFDMDMDDLYFRIDWGDGTISDWTGPFDSLDSASINHKWMGQGNYQIEAQAKDDPNGDGDLSDGQESEWSEPLTVEMPRKRYRFPMIEYHLKKIINIFPTFNHLIGFFDQDTTNPKFQISNTQVPPTEITLDEQNCKITITIRIQIWGEGASSSLASSMETAVENKLNTDKNGDPWYLKCPKEECEEETPGCLVEFDFIIKYQQPPKSGQGYHIFYVAPVQNNIMSNPNRKRFVSYTYTADVNKNDNIVDFPRPNDVTSTYPLQGDTKIFHFGGTNGVLHADDRVGTWAHEFMHCLGLDDKYIELWDDKNGDTVRDADEVTPTPKPGHADDIMANATKWLQQWAINQTMGRINLKCPCKCCPEEEDDTPPETNINSPPNGEPVESPCPVIGYADDGPEGSGIVLLDYMLEWDGGEYDGEDYPIDPPLEYVSFELGPLNLDNYVDPGDQISITVFATDDAGNTGSDIVTVTLEEDEDTIPPVTEKTIGEPQWEGGYTVASYTPIWLEATDPEPSSGVDYIHYEVWQEGILKGSQDYPGDTVEMTFGMYGVIYGIAELRWYAVDNAENVEDMQYQEHFILY